MAPRCRRCRYDYVTENGTLGLQQLDEVHALSPTRFILNTEACVLEELVDGWGLAWLYAADILGDLNHHVSGWVYWNSALLTGDKYPFWRGGPNHDNTTKFGDPVLFEFNATGSQRLIFQVRSCSFTAWAARRSTLRLILAPSPSRPSRACSRRTGSSATCQGSHPRTPSSSAPPAAPRRTPTTRPCEPMQ